MTSFRIRPRFEYLTDMTITDINERLRQIIKRHSKLCLGGIDHHVVIKMDAGHVKIWSPQCSLNFEEDTENKKVLVRGLYGPNPNVWFFFVLTAGVLLTLMMFIAIIGLSQRSLGHQSDILWLLIPMGGAVAGLYFLSQLGQKLGADQTYDIHHFVEEVFNTDLEIN